MTRVAIDAATAIRLVREGATVHDEHQLVAPNLLRSQALSSLYRDVRRGVLGEDEARALLDGVTTLRIRLLGDRVSRAVAWQIAARLGWDDTTHAEYVAVAKLQADVLVTADEELARQVAGIVRTGPFELLTSPAPR
jgi:predicted nucleic acid-binding protein